jgi:fructose-1,6-bisphosphatase/inositol monophosphatase family enzyme
VALSTDEVLELMQSVAAEVITPRFRSLAESEIDEKRPGDLVTIADHEAEELITKALLEAYPDAVVLGEEAHASEPELMDRFRAADHGFTVDPVDGTKNFVNGSKDHAVMIAEVVDGETVRGWIWQPEHQQAWVAELGGGVRRNGEMVRREPAGDQPQGATSIWSRRGRQPIGLPKLIGTWVCCGVDYPKLIEGAADYVL